ncbi:MAG: hypothetical protein WC916_04990 [Candidatus Woesearchaeota archaeon]
MADGKIKIDFDPLVNYFKKLSVDMLVAYGVIVLGVILVIVGIVLI